MKVKGITGMPGSGKGIVAGVARNLGFQVIRMGDVIREEAQIRDANVGETAIELVPQKPFGAGHPKSLGHIKPHFVT